MNDVLTTADGWHVPALLRRAWAAGAVPDEQAWSVEAHLMACRPCRDDVATDLVTSSRQTSPVARLVDDVHARLAVLPAPAALRPARRHNQVRSLLGLRQVGYAWAGVVVAVLAVAAVLDLVEGSDLLGTDDRQGALAWFAAGGSWVAALAPLLPVLGVALTQGPAFDPAHEAVAATPPAGLRLVLWRTVGVLLTALPAALALELVMARSRGGPGTAHLSAWILPAVVLTALTLAVGSVVGTTPAAAVIALAWVLGSIAPLAAGSAPTLLDDVSRTAWAVTALVACAVIAARRDRLGRLDVALRVGGVA